MPHHQYHNENTTYNFTSYNHVPVRFGGLCGLSDIAGIHVYTTILILLAIISTVENLVVLIVISKNKVLHTPSMLLLGILAGIDFITGCVVTPIKASITQHPNVYENWVLVKVFGVLFMAAVIFSLSTVMLISFERFCHVYFLDNYNLTKNKICIALFCTWIAPVLFLILLIADVHVGFAGGVFALIYFFACILAMIVSYIATVITLKNHAANTYYEMRQDMIETQRRAVKTVLIIVVTFIVMNIPPILSVALLFMRIYSGELCAITFFVMLANSAVNPWIYCLRIPILKEKVLSLLMLKNESATENADEFRDISITEPSGVNFQNSVVIINGDESGNTSETPEENAQDTREVGLRKYVNF